MSKFKESTRVIEAFIFELHSNLLDSVILMNVKEESPRLKMILALSLRGFGKGKGQLDVSMIGSRFRLVLALRHRYIARPVQLSWRYSTKSPRVSCGHACPRSPRNPSPSVSEGSRRALACVFLSPGPERVPCQAGPGRGPASAYLRHLANARASVRACTYARGIAGRRGLAWVSIKIITADAGAFLSGGSKTGSQSRGYRPRALVHAFPFRSATSTGTRSPGNRC